MNTLSNMRTLKEIEPTITVKGDKSTAHSYLNVYDDIFKSRQSSVTNVLDIGLYQGHSMLLWKEYFENALITGIEIGHDPFAGVSDPRLRVVIGDAYTKETYNIVADKKYDVIVDDGSHSLQHIQYVAQHYTNLLASNGILVIEDVQYISWVDQIIESFPEHYKNKVQVYDLRDIKGRWDDILIVLDLSKE